ncbi:hypothetical protein OUZ56_005934 [Daphnia magna]|uniref:Uncharacterized protein n=1 Tax=Daphnia magna TaxID=35525 RepID=A0ABQ9YU63_9CRUS|nr:hypothetical protein OUZ56_005934 [Daphnia magna]
MPNGNQVEKCSRKPASRYSPESSPKHKTIRTNPSPEELVYNKEMTEEQDHSTVITRGSVVEGKGRLILEIAVPGQSLVRLKPVHVRQIQVAGPLITEDQFLHCQPQPSPSDDDAYAQPMHSSGSRYSLDSNREYFPQKDNGEDEMNDEEASDVEQQTNFAENDRDRISASNLSSTPKTYIHKKRSRLEFRSHEEQSEAAPQHESQEGSEGEKFQIEVNQDSIFKLFKLLPIMQSTLNEVLRRKGNTMRHLKLLDQKMEDITRKLAGVNNAGPSESEHVARMLSKLPLNSVDEMTEFLGEIKDAIADKCITIEYLVTSNVSDCDRENVDAVFVDFVNTSCCEVDNEQDYGESDDSGENEDDSGDN